MLYTMEETTMTATTATTREVQRMLPKCRSNAPGGLGHSACPGRHGPFQDKDGEFVVVCSCVCHPKPKETLA